MGYLGFFITFIVIQFFVILYRPISAQVILVGLIMMSYYGEAFPHIEASRWHGKYDKLHNKLLLVSKILGESRRKDYEEIKNVKRMERRNHGMCQGIRFFKGESDPLDKCSKEVWTVILENINEPDDIVSCYYTCSLFRNLMQTRMTAQAFFVLDEYLKKKTVNVCLEHDDFLTCRLVSTNWKLSIDDFLQHHPSQLNFYGNFYPTTVIESEDIKHVEGLIQRLVNDYQYSNINPFPSRHLRVKINSNVTGMEYKIFHTAVSILLKYFGKHVWYFTFQVNEQEVLTDTLTLYQAVRDFMNKTSNLKMADLYLSGGQVENEQSDRKLKEFMDKNSFPKLKKLRALKIVNGPGVIIDSALRRNKYIEKLMISPKNSNHDWIKYDGNILDLQTLTDLSVFGVDQLAWLEHVNWPLSRLTLQSDRENENNRQRALVDLNRVFKFLEKFHDSLQYLNLKVRGYGIVDLLLTLPELEELEVHFEEKLYLDFILPLKSLKSLRVHIYDERNYNDENELEIIKFKDHVEELQMMNKTNVWDLFPELNEVSVSIMVHDNDDKSEKRNFKYTRCGDTISKQVKIEDNI